MLGGRAILNGADVRPHLAVGLALLLLGATGCGSSASQAGSASASGQEAVRQLVNSYDSALARGDATQACQDSTKELQAALVATVRRSLPWVSSCYRAMKLLLTDGHVVELVDQTRVGSIRVEGDQATIASTRSTKNGRPINIQSRAVLEGGAWKLAEERSE